MRLVGCFVAFLLVFGCFSSPAFSSDEITPEQVLKLADREKDAYFGMIVFDYAVKYSSAESSGKSFQTVQDPIKYSAGKQTVLKLGTPFQVYTISSDDITDYREGEDISGMLIPTKLWLIPLEISGKARACMEVGFQDEKWQVVGISMGEFGENLKKIPAQFAPGKGGNKYVRVYLANTDFIAIESGGETKSMVPSYSEKSFEKKTKDINGLYRSSDIMPELAKKIQSARNAR